MLSQTLPVHSEPPQAISSKFNYTVFGKKNIVPKHADTLPKAQILFKHTGTFPKAQTLYQKAQILFKHTDTLPKAQTL